MRIIANQYNRFKSGQINTSQYRSLQSNANQNESMQINTNYDKSNNGVFTKKTEVLSNDYFKNLSSVSTTLKDFFNSILIHTFDFWHLYK